ncbi:MAG TPA: DUF4232 domain-containing protein [Streptosporangiaceae bacterium]|nr:DUF4232 domain-containing protein [Streptosporangiaceae bacterium]
MTPPVHSIRLLVSAAALLSAAVLVTACGSAASPSSAGGATSPAQSASPPAATTAPPATTPSSAASAAATGGAPAACATSALKVTVLTVPGSGTAGTEHFPIDFTNVSRESCNLFGYPGVSFVTGPGGSQIGAAAARQPVNPPAEVVLAPGATAYATLSIEDPGVYSPSACHQVTAHWLRVYPPNQTASVTVGFSTAVCQSLPAGLGKQLAVAVVQPGNGKSHPEP